MQAGYILIAARLLGLDCGPMNGFNKNLADEAFYSGTSWRSNMLINLGYGDYEEMRPRAPRIDFANACQIL